MLFKSIIKNLKPGKGGEIWLVDAINELIKIGYPVYACEIENARYYDTGNKIEYLKTVVVVPLTSTLRPYPTRVDCHFQGKQGQLAIDQIRCLDKTRLGKKLGELDIETSIKVCALLVETFRY